MLAYHQGDVTKTMRRSSTRRRALGLAGAALAAPALAVRALAGTPWPAKPVRFIVPVARGEPADAVVRLIAPKLADVWKQEVFVENKVGRGGIVATEYGKAAAPDGYTLMVVSSDTFGIYPSLYAKLPYKPLVDFLPISNIFFVPLVIVAHLGFPAKTLAELIKLVRDAPGTYAYASSGSGTMQHLAMELLKLRAGLDIMHVPYEGSDPAMDALLGGRVKLMMAEAPSVLDLILGDRVKALAVTTAKRAPPPLDAIPPVADTLPGFDAAGWSGIAAPAGTPLEIVAKVNKDLQALVGDSEVVRGIEQRVAMPAPSSPFQFAEFIKNEIDTWGEVVRAIGIKPRT